MCLARDQDALIERRLASLPIHTQERRVNGSPKARTLPVLNGPLSFFQLIPLRKKTEAMYRLRREVKELEKDANTQLQLTHREGRGEYQRRGDWRGRRINRAT
jgi:hypothetical protein